MAYTRGFWVGAIEIHTKILKNLFRTAKLRCLKFGLKHCLVDLYTVYTNGGPTAKNALWQEV